MECLLATKHKNKGLFLFTVSLHLSPKRPQTKGQTNVLSLLCHWIPTEINIYNMAAAATYLFQV